MPEPWDPAGVAPEDDTDGEPIEVVASVGPLDDVVALLREYLHRSGAVRAVAVVGGAPGESPAVVDCGRLAPIEVDFGDRVVQLPHGIELDVAPPELPELRQLPPFDVDAVKGEVAAPPGGLHHVADGVRALAQALGGRNVAMAQFQTNDPAAPLAITARADGSDPLVLALGEDEFEMEPGWP
jgi:hypothetical protein